MAPLRVAIIGGGAAAAGVLQGLAHSRTPCEVTLFHPNEPFEAPLQSPIPDDALRPTDYFAALYRYLRQEHGFKFPPPKTHFGVSPRERSTIGGARLWETLTLGGLTNFWGASAVPFTQRELGGWPISPADLSEYYQYAAEQIGIAGTTDNLTHYFGRDYVTRAPVRPVPVAQRLSEELSPSAGGYSFLGGVNRLAVETRVDQDNRCIMCGACMTGCGSGSIYSARADITRHLAEGRLQKIVVGSVRSVDLQRRAIRLDDELDDYSFDRIFLAAGCIGSTEVMMRSFGLREGLVMFDNVAYTFPILYLGSKITDTESKRYFGLSNTAIICAPEIAGTPSSFIQVYPLFDHLWRYFLPISFWPAFAPIAERLRARMLIARLYLHSSQGTTYAFHTPDHSNVEITRIREAPPLDRGSGLWPALRAAVSQNSFVIPPLRPIRSVTSSHYAGSLPLGGALVSRDGRFAEGIYLCDAANFVDGPALSPTLTIMANAARVAHQAL
jgi:choline dehydrogenase-like flavoprotein